jgi:predicted nuclease of predicted toxin-antitoxin system
MKLLLDENISRRLVALLQSNLPGSEHVIGVGLAGASDREIFGFSGKFGYTLVTKDDDFVALAAAAGYAQSLILIRLGNVDNSQLLQALNGSVARIEALFAAGTRVVEIT